MLINIILLILGLGLLVKGGGIFVDSSIAIARIKKIPPLIIGATIVSIATTFPELVASATAALRGETGLAIGNAVGSCIVNIGLVIGLVCLVKTAIIFSPKRVVFSLRWMLWLAAFIFILTLPLKIYRPFGPLLIISAIIFLILNIKNRKELDLSKKSDLSEIKYSLPMYIILFIGGAILVIFGSHILVYSAVNIAQFLGISPTVIGLSIVAVGTSLPELTTGLASVKRNKTDLSLGNVIGANVLNMTLIIGTAATIRPLTLSRFTQIYSILAMVLISSVLAFFILARKELTRKEGKVIFSLYVLYIFGLVIATLAGIR